MKKYFVNKSSVILTLVFVSLIAFSGCIFETDDDPTDILTGNVIDSEITVSTTLTADKTWIVDGYINVSADLIIEPGTVIKFKEDAALAFSNSGNYSSLTALGTADKPILFTSAAAVNSLGDYLGLLFFEKVASSSIMEYCTVEYAGGDFSYHAAVYMENCKISMNHCTIQKSKSGGILGNNGATFVSFNANTITECEDYPISIQPLAVHTLNQNNTFEGMGINVVTGNLEKLKVTWPKFDIPYVVQDLYIQNDAELTLTAGSTFKFHPDGGIMLAWDGSYGKLVAQGTSILPIIFTSAANSPSNGDWSGLLFFEKTANGSLIQYCTIEYGGSTSWYSANIYVEFCDSKLSILNCQINNSSTCGLKINDASPTLIDNTYQGNADDICTN